MDTARIATRFVAPPPSYRERSNRANHPQVLRVTCGSKKENKKLVKGLKKDLALFANMRYGIDQNSGLADSVHESLITVRSHSGQSKSNKFKHKFRKKQSNKIRFTSRDLCNPIAKKNLFCDIGSH